MNRIRPDYKHKFGNLLLAISIMSLPHINIVHAQEIKGKKLEKFSPEYWSKTKRHENFYSIKEALPLPALPNYPGKTHFVRGFVEPVNTGGNNYQLVMLVKDKPETVKGFYLDILSGNGWNIFNSSGGNISARNSNKDLCTIMTGPTQEKIDGQEYKTSLRIRYRESGK